MKEEGTNKINREALFSAETEDYRSPMEPKEGGTGTSAAAYRKSGRGSGILYRRGEGGCYEEDSF